VISEEQAGAAPGALPAALPSPSPRQRAAPKAIDRVRGLSAGLLLLAIGLLPALAGSAWYLHHARKLAVQDAFAQADLMAIGTVERLRWLLQDAESMLATIAERPLVRALDPTRCDAVFQDFKDISPSFKAVALRRLDGASVCSELAQPPSQQSVAATPWFQAALRHDGFHASNVHPGNVRQAWTARLTQPVKDASGVTAAMLITAIDLKQLQQRLFARLPSQATSAVVDGDNLVLVRSTLQEERVGKPGAPGVVRVLNELRQELVGADRGVSRSRQFVETSIDGTRRLFVVRSVPMTDWMVVSTLPEAETLQAYVQSRNQSLLAIALILALAALAAWRVSRAILVPIRGLATAARGMAEGAAAPHAPESGPREIREVAREFNRMVRVTAESGEQLRASESHYRSLIQGLPVAVISYRADGAIEIFNDSACRLLQMSAAQLERGTADPGQAWHFVDAQGARLPLAAHPPQQVLHSQRALAPQVLGLVHEAPDGAPAGPQSWVMVSAYPQFDAAQQLMRVIVVFVDITTQHQSEQLRVAKDAAEAASKAKSAFLSRVSHELRTPLNAINGFSELMVADARLAPDQRDKIGHVLNAGKHLLSLINQILDLTRIESGPPLHRLQPVALWPLLQECLAICEPLAQVRQVTLVLLPADAAAEPPWVLGDATALRQVLMNLLSNGVKYNRPGGRVSVQLRQEPADRGATDTVLSVCDTGSGLSATQIEGLFQPFNRLGAEHRGIEGHGLGLVISRLLAQSMGGDITVRSTEGEGSCFDVLLHGAAPADEPVVAPERPPADTPVSPPAPSPASSSTPPAAPAGPEVLRPLWRVLYIEDNPMNMTLMRHILALRGDIDFHGATDGLSGVAAARRLQPDLVLIDIGLPLLDGFGVLEQLRRHGPTSRTPCWAVTADTTPETAARARAAGFARYVTKPVSVSELREALDAWMRASEPRAEGFDGGRAASPSRSPV